MRITVGLDGQDTPSRIDQLIDCGADEFFAGYVPREWSETYGWEIGPNRRTFGKQCQFTDTDALRSVVSAARARGKSVAITLNAQAFVQEQIPRLRRLVAALEELEPHCYIVADPALLTLFAEWGIERPLHLSTGAACFNAATVRYYCSIANVRRVILPRKLTLNEMGELIDRLSDLRLEFEAMIIGYRCFFNDEFCFTHHSGAGSNFCRHFCLAQTVTAPRWPDHWKELIEEAIEDPANQFVPGSALDRFAKALVLAPEELSRQPEIHGPGDQSGLHLQLATTYYTNCGLCAVKRLREMGVDVLKVPLRGEPLNKARIVRDVRSVVDQPNPTRDFCRGVIDSSAFCDAGCYCYYDLDS